MQTADDNKRWGWLLVLAAAGVFLRWAALSCYHDSIDSKGPGGAFTWVFTGVLYGLAYAALLPAYLWLAWSRSLWWLLVVGPLIGASGYLLYWYASFLLDARALTWGHWRGQEYLREHYGLSRLLLSLGATILLVLLGVGRRLWLRWSQSGNASAR